MNYDNSTNPEEQAIHIMMRENPHQFYEDVLDAIRECPAYVFEDPNPYQKKVKSLNRMIKHFEDLERYEDCGFLLNVLNQLKRDQ